VKFQAKERRWATKYRTPTISQNASFTPIFTQKGFFVAEENKWITLKVSTKVIKTINLKGISAVLKEARQKGTLTATI